MVSVRDDVHLATVSLISPAALLPDISYNNLTPCAVHPVTVTMNETYRERRERESVRPIQRVVSKEAVFKTYEKGFLCGSRQHVDLEKVIAKSVFLFLITLGIHSFVDIA